MPQTSTQARRARRAVVALAAAAVTAAGLGATTVAAAPPQGAPATEHRALPDRARGEAAIRALGDRLPAVAAAHGTTAEVLRDRFRTDDELWADPSGALLFIDEGLAEHAEHADEPATTTVDGAFGSPSTADAFALHSRPGASRVVHLDFDGHTSPGAGWSGTPAPAFSLDGDRTTFSASERQVIIDVWRHVAEDFAPFDIDVTTQDPGIDAIRRTTSSDTRFGTRVVVTPTKTDCGSCGGIAYVGTYDIYGSDSTGYVHDRYQPAWVYIAGSNAKSIAEAASHEAGHNLGLSHDGVTGGTGYYAGHGDWAPIMGVGYYEPITQWSRGEYAGANNAEDDLAVIAANGGTPVADDHGATTSTATVLGTGTVDVSGVLGSDADVDAFTFTAGAGPLSLDATGAPLGGNADLALRLLDGAGRTVQLANPVGLATSLQATVAAGTYTVIVDGTGAGDPLTTGYSGYASVGRYRLRGTIPAGTTVTPTNQAPVASATATPTSGTAPLAVTLDGSGSSDPDGDQLTFSWDLGDGTTKTGPTASHSFAAGTHVVTLTVSDGTTSSTASLTITASAPPAVVKPAAPRIDATASGSTVTVAWADVSGETRYELWRETRMRNGKYGSRTLVATLAADSVRATNTPGSGTFRYQVVAANSAGSAGSNLDVVSVSSTSTTTKKTARTR